MARASSFKCPKCNRILKTSAELQPGAKMRCPHEDCREVFTYPSSQNTATEEEEAPPDDKPEYDLMIDLLAEDDVAAPPKSPAKASGSKPETAVEPVPRALNVPQSPLPRLSRSRVTQQPLAGHPLAQASQRSKEKLIGGKGIRWDEPRKYVGVLIAFLILAGGYAGFLVFSAFWHATEHAAETRAKGLAKKFQEAEAAKKKKYNDMAALVTRGQNVPATAKASQVAPASTANLAVTIESVRQGAFFPPDQRDFCEVKLRITNESKVATHKTAWPGPNVKATLRDVGLNQYKLIQPSAREATIAGGESIRETLYFEPTVRGRELTLELTIPHGVTATTTKLKILPTQIQYVES